MNKISIVHILNQVLFLRPQEKLFMYVEKKVYVSFIYDHYASSPLQDKNVYEAAIGRVKQFMGKDVADAYAKKAGFKKTEPETWQELLHQHRRQLCKPLNNKKRKEYEAAVRLDQRVPRRKFLFPEKIMKRAGEAEEAAEKQAVQDTCGEIGHLAPNDTDLPLPSEEKARMVEAWCKQGSWAMCEKCHSMCPRNLGPMDLRRVNKATILASQCPACKYGEYVPQPEHVPEPLRNLKPLVLEALRPLDMDIGPEVRAPHGYPVKSGMMAFSWKEDSVVAMIQALPKRKDRKAAKKALDFLLESEESAYKEFHQRHEEFLQKKGRKAEHKLRRRSLRFIEEPGLECALWPHLYWHKNLCETVARAAADSRMFRQGKGKKRRVADTESEDLDADQEARSNASKCAKRRDGLLNYMRSNFALLARVPSPTTLMSSRLLILSLL